MCYNIRRELTPAPAHPTCDWFMTLPHLLTPRPHDEQRLLAAAFSVHLPEVLAVILVFIIILCSPEFLVVVIPGGDHQPRHPGLQLILEVTHLRIILTSY